MSVLTALLGGRMPHSLLFDLDGTLVDSVPDLASAVDAMLADLDLPLAGVDRVRHWVGNGATELVRRALAGCDLPAQTGAISGERLNLGLARFREHYRRCNGQHSRVYPGVEDSLRILRERGTRLGLVTNKPVEFIEPLLGSVGLAGWFDVHVGGDSLPVKKPSPAPLLYAMAYLESPPDAVMVIGDSRNDIAAARAASLPVIVLSYGYNHGEDIHQAGADLVVDSLEELL